MKVSESILSAEGAPEVATERNMFDQIVEGPMRRLEALLHGIDSVALVDYPEYANVGDSLIWLGQVALYRRIKKKIVYVDAAWHSDDDALRRVVRRGAAIVIMGGGNFGTLWPHHQRYRESLMRKFPDATIIQMAQSLSFDDEKAVAQAREAIAGCSDFHLLVRDVPSLNFARTRLQIPVMLFPDCAFFIGPIEAPTAIFDVAYLRRMDKESIGDGMVANPGARGLEVETRDWLQQDFCERALQRIVRGLIRWRILRNTDRLTLNLYNLLARIRVCRGVRILARGRCVISDRLHAHILSLLIGRPNLMLNSSSGKVFAFHVAWTWNWPNVAMAQTPDEAFEMADYILRGQVE